MQKTLDELNQSDVITFDQDLDNADDSGETISIDELNVKSKFASKEWDPEEDEIGVKEGWDPEEEYEEYNDSYSIDYPFPRTQWLKPFLYTLFGMSIFGAINFYLPLWVSIFVIVDMMFTLFFIYFNGMGRIFLSKI